MQASAGGRIFINRLGWGHRECRTRNAAPDLGSGWVCGCGFPLGLSQVPVGSPQGRVPRGGGRAPKADFPACCASPGWALALSGLAFLVHLVSQNVKVPESGGPDALPPLSVAEGGSARVGGGEGSHTGPTESPKAWAAGTHAESPDEIRRGRAAGEGGCWRREDPSAGGEWLSGTWKVLGQGTR